MSESNSDSEDKVIAENLVVLAPGEMLHKGLVFAGISEQSIARCKNTTNQEKFVNRYGCRPIILCQIWEDIQRTPLEEARVPPKKLNLEYFLMAIHFLRHYPDEHERAAATGFHRDTCRDWSWYYVECIKALKDEKINWIDDANDTWVMTVDGTHCWVHEPTHPEFSMDTDFYSHKYNKAGVNYEIGISLKHSKVVWLNGPFKAGESDQKTFRERGLRAKLRQHGKKVIADGGYHAEEDFDVLALPNTLDKPLVKKFKRRALKRHEKFNGMTKTFNCLSQRFRHPIHRFPDCFEAVCVICQYQLDMGSPLYNVLVNGM